MNDWFSIVQSKFKIGHFIPPIHVSARRGWDVNNQSKNFTLSFVARFAKEIRHMKEIIWKLITPPAVLCDGHAHKFLIVEKKSQIQKCTTRSLLLVKRCQLIRRTRTAQYVSRPLNAMAYAYRIHILLYQSKRYISVDKWIIRRSGTIATRVGKKNKVTAERHDHRCGRKYSAQPQPNARVPSSHDCTYFLWAKDPNKKANPYFEKRKRDEANFVSLHSTHVHSHKRKHRLPFEILAAHTQTLSHHYQSNFFQLLGALNKSLNDHYFRPVTF